MVSHAIVQLVADSDVTTGDTSAPSVKDNPNRRRNEPVSLIDRRVRGNATHADAGRAGTGARAGVIDGPHAARWYRRQELEDMALSTKRMGYPAAKFTCYRPNEWRRCSAQPGRSSLAR
jgi:hypothetical protein